MLDIESISKMFCFCVKRHPVERVLSTYKYWCLDKQYSFDSFCDMYLPAGRCQIPTSSSHTLRTHLRKQIDFIRLPDGSIPSWIKIVDIDQLDKFLAEQFPTINSMNKCNRINQKSNDKPIKVSEKTVEIIYNSYIDDFDYFGYSK